MTPGFHEFMCILPECILIFSALSLIIYSAFTKADHVSLHATQAVGVAIMACALAAISTLLTKGGDAVVFHAMLSTDPYVTFSKAFVLFAAIVTLVMLLPHLERASLLKPEFPILILFAVVGMLIMVSSQDLMSLFLGVELQSLSIYVMTAFAKDDMRSNEAAMKYFVLGSLSSAVLLYGFSLIYGYLGSTNFDAIFDALRQHKDMPISLGLQFAAVLILSGLAFKISAVPFHMWTPDVYEGIPMPLTGFFAALPKLAAVLMVYRLILGPFAPLATTFSGPLIILSIASCFFGSIAGVYQAQLKRLVAYSSISHVGFILLGLIAHSTIGVQGALFYLGVYFLMTIALFTCLLCLKREGRSVQSIADLRGLNQEHPLMAAVIALILFSMAGIPPLAGFFGKFYVILSLVESGSIVTASLAITSSVIAAFFYIRIVKVMYFDTPSEEEVDGKIFQHVRLSSGRLILGFCLATLLLMSIAPERFIQKTSHAANHLLHN